MVDAESGLAAGWGRVSATRGRENDDEGDDEADGAPVAMSRRVIVWWCRLVVAGISARSLVSSGLALATRAGW